MKKNNIYKKIIAALLIAALTFTFYPGAYAQDADIDPFSQATGLSPEGADSLKTDDLQAVSDGETQAAGTDGTYSPNDADQAVETDGLYSPDGAVAPNTGELQGIDAEKIPTAESDGGFSLFGADTLSIDSVQVINGGAVQATYRPEKVTESDGKYYTKERNASMTDPRIFKVSVVFDNLDGAGQPFISGDSEEVYTAFLQKIKWTYGGKPFSEWKKAASGVNGAFNGVPFITLLNSNLSKVGDRYKLEAEIRFDTPLYALSNAVNINTNIPYAPYPNITQSGNSSYHPQLIDSLVGSYELALRYDADDVVSNNNEEKELGTAAVRLTLYDSFHTWPEINQFAKDLKAEAESNNGVINNRYVSVQSLAKGLRGNDIWNVVIADSKASVDEYLNVTKPLLQTNPTALAEKIPGGNQKIPIYFNVIHADEVPGIDGNVNTINSFIRDDVISFRSYDEVDENPGTLSTNGNAREKADSNISTYSYKVADALDKFIIVVTITSNTDGRELVLAPKVKFVRFAALVTPLPLMPT